MLSQNKILSHPHRKLNFGRILVNDSTSYGLPSKFYNEFKGYGFISKLKSTTVIYKKNPNPQRNSRGEIINCNMIG